MSLTARYALRSMASCRSQVLASKTTIQKRTMALGSPRPKVNYEGIEKTIRDKFPEDYQLSYTILGGYFGMIILAKIYFALKPAKVEAAPATVVQAVAVKTTGDVVPDVASEEFEKFVETDAFFKVLDSEELLNAWIKKGEIA